MQNGCRRAMLRFGCPISRIVGLRISRSFHLATGFPSPARSRYRYRRWSVYGRRYPSYPRVRCLCRIHTSTANPQADPLQGVPLGSFHDLLSKPTSRAHECLDPTPTDFSYGGETNTLLLGRHAPEARVTPSSTSFMCTDRWMISPSFRSYTTA